MFDGVSFVASRLSGAGRQAHRRRRSARHVPWELGVLSERRQERTTIDAPTAPIAFLNGVGYLGMPQ
jgi:hypothetical protein